MGLSTSKCAVYEVYLTYRIAGVNVKVMCLFHSVCVLPCYLDINSQF